MSRARLAAAGAAGRLADRWRGRLTARATDARPVIAGRGLLVVAPHPDDETFGCGALIARARAAGADVTVVVASDGARSTVTAKFGPAELAALRSAELREACRRLDVPDVLELGHPDGSLAGRAELADELAGLIADRRPGVVLTPCAQDPHADHLAVHRATVAALARVPGDPLLLGYPVWAWHAGPFFLAAPRRSAAAAAALGGPPAVVRFVVAGTGRGVPRAQAVRRRGVPQSDHQPHRRARLELSGTWLRPQSRRSQRVVPAGRGVPVQPSAHGAPLTDTAVGGALLVRQRPCRPTLTLPPAGMTRFQRRSVRVSVAPVWLNPAFHTRPTR